MVSPVDPVTYICRVLNMFGKADMYVLQSLSTYVRGEVVQWIERQTQNRPVVSSSPITGTRCFIEQELYHICLVLIGPRNGYERELHKIKLLVSQSNTNKLIYPTRVHMHVSYLQKRPTIKTACVWTKW